MAMKRRRATSPASRHDTTAQTNVDDATLDGHSVHASKKLRLLAQNTASSPFADFPRPSAEEVQAVYALLASHTPGGAPVYSAGLSADAPNSAGSCGHTPNVLDALIGTILSQHTSAANSTAAKHALDATFGRGDEHAFEAMAHADPRMLADTIRAGGLANRKAKSIQGALDAVKRRHGRYDLQYLAAPGVTDADAMQTLVALDGVGPKTAACVLSFCLGRQAFAVDTHVFRLVKLLGWVPGIADRVGAQAHLEQRVPAELKYGLHVMMVRHGRVCRGCKKDGRGACPLKNWLKERAIMSSEPGEIIVKDDGDDGDSKVLLRGV